MIVQSIPIPSSRTLTALPLTRDAFGPYGDVLANPAPSARPSSVDSPEAVARLPCGAVSANQGTAIQYKNISSFRNLYPHAPSTQPASPRMTMFVCETRADAPTDTPAVTTTSTSSPAGRTSIPVRVLERHPFTTQTFTPLTSTSSSGSSTDQPNYLVIVAPSLPPSALDAGLPVPVPPADGTKLPGRGLPDLARLVAFVATGAQAVTYGPGTWHAPMVALGPPGTTLDFVVVQFANDVPVEDCQEVTLGPGLDGRGGDSDAEITVKVEPTRSPRSRL